MSDITRRGFVKGAVLASLATNKPSALEQSTSKPPAPSDCFDIVSDGSALAPLPREATND